MTTANKHKKGFGCDRAEKERKLPAKRKNVVVL